MTVDHYGGTAGVATLLVRAMDEILGTHTVEARLFTYNQAIMALTLTERLAAGCGEDNPAHRRLAQ
jgi:hypothetical protein